MNGHDELISLLGAYALDAVDDEERRAIEEHLDVCADCRAEVARHLEVAAALGTTAASAAPDELWASIALHLGDGPVEAPDSPPLLLLSGPPVEPARIATADPAPGTSTVVALDERRRRPLGAILASVAAAAVIAVLAVGLVQANRQNAELEAQIAQPSSIEDVADAALANPANRVIELTSDTGDETARAVVTPAGDGYLVASTLDPLPADRTYQLWNIGEAGAISLGVLGRDPGATAFHVQGPITTLAITAEREGGVPAPENIPLVTSTA